MIYVGGSVKQILHFFAPSAYEIVKYFEWCDGCTTQTDQCVQTIFCTNYKLSTNGISWNDNIQTDARLCGLKLTLSCSCIGVLPIPEGDSENSIFERQHQSVSAKYIYLSTYICLLRLYETSAVHRLKKKRLAMYKKHFESLINLINLSAFPNEKQIFNTFSETKFAAYPALCQ